MTTFKELSNQSKNLMQQCESLAKKLGFESSERSIQENIEGFNKRELRVVIAGEACRGKSSMLNAFLGEKNPLCPVDINVCTNVVTVVKYGEKERIVVYIEDPNSKNGSYLEEQISRDQIADFVSEKGNPNNFKNVKMLVAEIPNGLLKEGIVFVDTPGVGGLNVEHSETTFSFLPNADLLLFVSDSDSGMTDSELNFLKRGYKYCQSIVYTLTKKDVNSNYLEILKDNRNKISKTLEVPADEIQIIPVSSTAKLQYLKTGNKTMYANSNYAALEEAVWTAIAKRKGEVLLLPFLLNAKKELLKITDSVVAQLAVLKSEKGTAEKLVEGLQGKRDQLEDLQDKGAAWRTKLQLFFSNLNADIKKDQQQLKLEARNLVEDQAKRLGTKLCKEDNHKQLVADINDLTSQRVIDIQVRIDEEINTKAAELEEELNFNLNVNEDILEGMGFAPAEGVSVEFPTKGVFETIMTKGLKFSSSVMGGGALGGIIATITLVVFGGPVAVGTGAVIGAAAGLIYGVKKIFQKYSETDLNAVKKTMFDYIDSSMTHISNTIEKVLNELKITMTNYFDQQLKKTSKEIQENAARIQNNAKLTKDEVTKKFNALQKQAELLKKQLALFETIEKGVSELKPLPTSPKRRNKPSPAPDKKNGQEPEISYDFL